MGAPVVSSARGGGWGRSLRGPVKRGSERPCAARAAQFVRERENQSCKRFGGALPAVGEPGRPVRARKSQSFSRCRVPGAAQRPGPGEEWWPVGERTPTPPGERAGRSPEPHASPDRESTERTPGAPPGAPEGAAMGHGRGGRPGRRELCRYLRHFRLRGTPKRGSRSNREGNFAAICGTCASGARQTGAPARAGGKSARIRGEMARECPLFPERSPVFLAVSGEERRFGPRGSLNGTAAHGFSGPN